MDSRYPGHYFEHFIICFSTTGNEPTSADFSELVKQYKEIEGQQSFNNLVEEVRLIDEKDDWEHFVQYGKDMEIELDKVSIKEMALAILEK